MNKQSFETKSLEPKTPFGKLYIYITMQLFADE